MKQIKELLVDLYGCQGDLDNAEFLIGVLRAAAQKMGSTVIKTTSHRFSPKGITAMAILAETHISIHTWPEYGYAALDIFICSNEIDPNLGWKSVKEALMPASHKIHELKRKIR